MILVHWDRQTGHIWHTDQKRRIVYLATDVRTPEDAYAAVADSGLTRDGDWTASGQGNRMRSLRCNHR